MPAQQLGAVLNRLRRALSESQQLADDARRWSAPGAAPSLTSKRRDALIEVAFLRGYIVWETFLEDCFILYLLGRKPPRGRPPYRYARPANRSAAYEFAAEGRDYPVWSEQAVRSRAMRFFRNGGHFAHSLQSNQTLFSEVRTIRNAVAHQSLDAREKFENLVRTKLGALPPNTTVGSFLNIAVPGVTPPTTFLEHYLRGIWLVAEMIVPAH